jgi:hypothetical protein
LTDKIGFYALADVEEASFEIAKQYDVEKERWNVRPQKRRWVLRM